MANLEADFYDFEALALLKTAPFSLRHAVHPLCCSHSHTLFEGGIERVSHGVLGYTQMLVRNHNTWSGNRFCPNR
jgi:hypothetical protein